MEDRQQSMKQNTSHSPVFRDKLELVQDRIESACDLYGRGQDEVSLLAVSKTKPIELIEQFYALGQRQFGENYLQEALLKIAALSEPTIQWHYIGAIQSNKTRPIAEHFDWVHTVSSLKVAKRLNDQRPESAPPLNVLIQVNIDREDSKSGVLPEDTDALINATREMGQLNLRGLMVIPKKSKDLDLIRDSFARTRLLQESIANRYCLAQFNQLSMGMSEDLELAIAEGATIIRIGSALFGPRDA
jgi:PLP dependent protein